MKRCLVNFKPTVSFSDSNDPTEIIVNPIHICNTQVHVYQQDRFK